MVDSDIGEFAKTLLAVADYYGKELSTGVVDLYWQGLREYDLGAVQKALWAHARNPDAGQFMPKIADVSRIMQGSTADQAAIAWSKVNLAVRRVGTYQDVVFDDALIHRVLADMGGWTLLGSKKDDEWPFVARDFENRYRGFRMRGDAPAYLPLLTGTANIHNQSEGFRLQPPVLIGDRDKAVQVMRGGSSTPALGVASAGVLAGAAGVGRIGRAA